MRPLAELDCVLLISHLSLMRIVPVLSRRVSFSFTPARVLLRRGFTGRICGLVPTRSDLSSRSLHVAELARHPKFQAQRRQASSNTEQREIILEMSGVPSFSVATPLGRYSYRMLSSGAGVCSCAGTLVCSLWIPSGLFRDV